MNIKFVYINYIMYRSLYWIGMGSSTGGIIYYTMICKILKKISEKYLLPRKIIMNIEELLLKRYLVYSMLLGGTIGYLTGNIYNTTERLLKKD